MTPRVLIQCGSYELDNLGEVAMLEVLVERLQRLNPRPDIAFFTRDVARARMISREIEIIPVESATHWRLISKRYLALRRSLPFIDTSFRELLPGFYSKSLRLKARQLANHAALRDADLLILSGGGYITDVFPGTAWSVLERASAAIEEGIPFALVGQGIGPLRNEALRAAAARVLPKAELIAVREGSSSVRILESLGVGRDRIHVTGDDAVELAYRARRTKPGASLGFNLRVADYTRIRPSDVAVFKSCLHDAARKLDTTLVPLPECMGASVEAASDAEIASQILKGFSPTRDIGSPANTASLLDRVGTCRVVVTGSYHAAVFALSQGIPAIGVFAAEYYEQKFRGLAAQFGSGCVVLEYSTPEFESRLHGAITQCWCAADELRAPLLAAAEAQLHAGRATFEQVMSRFATSGYAT